MIDAVAVGTLLEDAEWARMYDTSAVVHHGRLDCHASDGLRLQMFVGVTVVQCELLDGSIGVKVVYGSPGNFPAFLEMFEFPVKKASHLVD